MSAPTPAVFLSYASQDAGAATRIANALRGFGIEVWFDQNELRGGDQWDANIRGQIKECALFIPVISATTQSRDEAYFRLEWKLADDRTHLMAPGKTFIVPVVIDDTPDYGAAVPDSFTKAQWTRLPGGDPTTAFIEQIKRLTQKKPGSHVAGVADPGVADERPGSSPPATAPAKKRHPALTIGAATVIIVGIIAAFISTRGSDVAESTTTDLSAIVSPSETTADRPYIIGSVAALPLHLLTGAEEWANEAEGLHEELLNQLSEMRPLDVASRTSVLQYRDADTNLRVIGEALGVDFLVEGSVQKVGDEPRLTLQVIEVATDRHVFSRNFDYTPDEDQDPVVQQKTFAFNLALNIYRSLRDQRPPYGESAEHFGAVTNQLQVEASDLSAEFFGGIKTLDTYRALRTLLGRFNQIDPDNSFARSRFALIVSQAWTVGAVPSYWDPDYGRELGLALNRAMLVDPDNLVTLEQWGNYLRSILALPRQAVPVLRQTVADADKRIAAGETNITAWTYSALAEALYQSGQSTAAIQVLEKAPRPPRPQQIYNWSRAFLCARRPGELIRHLESFKGTMHTPHYSTELLDHYLDLRIAETEVGWTGSAAPALRLYEQIKDSPHSSPGMNMYLLRFTDHYQEMLKTQAQLGAVDDPMEPLLEQVTLDQVAAQRGLGNETLARSYLQSLLDPDIPHHQARSEIRWAKQAFYHAALGDREASLQAIAHSRAAMNPQRHLAHYIEAQRQLAFAYAQLGLVKEACAAIDAVLSSPGEWMTGNFLVDDQVSVIRHTAEFEAVIRKHANQLKDPTILDTYFAERETHPENLTLSE